MSDNSVNTLYYVHDPMCSWCWGFRTQLLKLKPMLSKDIEFVSLVGGLATDSEDPMPTTLQQDIQATWKHIQQVIPGTRFNFDFWTQNTPRRSTYPACRAVIAARQLADRADQMTYAIQQAYYLNAQNPSDLDILITAAGSIGLQTREFEQLMLSTEIEDLLITELEKVKSIHVYSFPSLVLQHNNELYPLKLDYNSAQNMMQDITAIVSGQRA